MSSFGNSAATTDAEREAEEFLGGGSVAAQFPEVGSEVAGTVLGWKMRQQTDMDTGELKEWKDGSPRKQMLVELQCEPTGVRWEGLDYEPVEIPDDDGIRTAYVKGNLQKALTKALRDSKSKMETGAYCRIIRGKDGPKTNPKYRKPFTFTVEWTPAAQNEKIANDFIDNSPFSKGGAQAEDDEPPF